MNTVTMDFPQVSRKNSQVPPEPQANLANDGTRRRKLTDESHNSKNEEAVQTNGQVSIKLEPTLKEENNNDNKEEEIKLPIVKNEVAGPPGVSQVDLAYNP